MKHKKILSKILSSAFVYIMLFAFMVCSVYAAQPAVNLRTAGDFVILAKSGISTTGTTSIIGDIGVSPISSTAITGFGLIKDSSNKFSTSSLVTGKIYAANYAVPTPAKMTAAISDMQTAYTDAAGRTLPDHTELGAGNIGGMTLAPGLYKWGTGVTIPTDVTLSGGANDVWIFQIAQTLDISSGKKIILSGGAQAKNVFWQVAGQATLGTTSVFNGNILGKTAIVMKTGATLNGKALAQTAVTLDANRVNAAASRVRVLTKIKVSPTSAILSVRSTLQLKAQGLDQFDSPIAATIRYSSNNPSVAKVNAVSGLVTAVASGTATITASSGAVKGYSTIIVKNKPAGRT